MGWYTPSSRQQFFQAYPKVDLHRHLEGSLRLKTLLDVAREHGITLPPRPTWRCWCKCSPAIRSTPPLSSPNFNICACFTARPR